MKYCGFDYSLTSPCVAIQGEDPSFQATEFHFLTDKKKLVGKLLPNVTGWLHQDWDRNEHRYDQIASWGLERLQVHDIRVFQGRAFIEGFAFRAKGNVFDLGECTGVLKHKMYKIGVPLLPIEPTVVKMDFSGSGGAKKEMMLQELLNRSGVDLKEIYGPNRKIGNPESDIADAFAVVLSGRKFLQNQG